ncbi:GTP-binding protein [Methanolapillus millepedarum]|uniref:CobW/HypB/UreG nucleotide-binding domain-containing protein n=1 Tax=Methanolapillus millepedarum TaxID=3028296 RepID=A0AA97A4E3_9EURY|nr:hypothetical protein MsAc7_13080 [Methanosarcinaceae archaeon Ac7]
MIRVLILSGFLGSGKTTTILKFVKMLNDADQKVAIIVNEIGEIGIDGGTLETSGIPIKQITNGCICCSLKMSLPATITEINNLFHPDVLIIEPTGISFPEQILNQLFEINVMMMFSPITVLVDVSRLETELVQIPNFINEQLQEARVVGLNKTDLATPEKIKSVEAFVKKINPDATLMHLSASKDDESVRRLYELLFNKDNSSLSSDYDADLMTKQHLDSIEMSNVTTYSALYHFKAPKTFSDKSAGKLLETVVTAAGADISKINPHFVGHIKMAIKVGNMMVKVSQTSVSNDRKLEAEYILQDTVFYDEDDEIELRFLSAVTNIPKEQLTQIVDQSIEVFLKAKGFPFEKHEHDDDHVHEDGQTHS